MAIDLPHPSLSVLIKLASLAVHADEMLAPGGHDLDREAIRGLLADTELRTYLAHPALRVYLPLKRSKRT